MQSELIDYYDGDILLEGCLVQTEDDRPKPLVLVAHDWTGRRQYAIDKAHEIAALGMPHLRLICTVKASLAPMVMWP